MLRGGDERKQTAWEVAGEFALCFLCLQASYLVWGIMQETIMNTQFIPTPLNPEGRFPSSTFCVVANRSLAVVVGGIACWWNHGTVKSSAPLISFTPCALSNTLSSWGQYEALAYVSFSMQTIFKSTKVIPVMFMGRLLKGTHYSGAEYLEAVMITVGVAIFSSSKANFEQSNNLPRQIIGVSLLTLYVFSDSFTSQWQSRLYSNYGSIDHYQMMFGVNVNAVLITLTGLLVTGEYTRVIDFFSLNMGASQYLIISALCSTTGQLGIFYTIKRFGPIVFTVIMLTRQIFSICLSNLLFGHTMALQSYVGAAIVFGVIGYSSHRKFSAQKAREEQRAKDEEQERLIRERISGVEIVTGRV